MSDKIRRGQHATSQRPTPAFIAGGVAAGVVLLLAFARDARRFFASHFQPRITFTQATPRTAHQPTSAPSAPLPAALFESPDALFEARLREAMSLALAASLAGLAGHAEGRPVQDVTSLVRGLAERGLLPPNVTLINDGHPLRGPASTLHLRLRPQPFAVEVLSLGRESRDGPALLVRVPDETSPARSGATRYFMALTLTNVKIPPPFATPTALLSNGWRADVLRPNLPTEADSKQLADWARTPQ